MHSDTWLLFSFGWEKFQFLSFSFIGPFYNDYIFLWTNKAYKSTKLIKSNTQSPRTGTGETDEQEPHLDPNGEAHSTTSNHLYQSGASTLNGLLSIIIRAQYVHSTLKLTIHNILGK